jgi:hypothetical protein
MYEQWVFFQLAGALRRAGWRCDSQDGLFHRARLTRFTLDVDRGARLNFLAPDGHTAVLRFEPWILPYHMAQERGDTLFRGTRGETAWSPDVLIEFLEPGQREPGGEVAYAVVVDAKYTRSIQDHHWVATSKYLQIKATRTRRQVVRQLWLAYPGEDGQITPEDSDITWTRDGPDCGREEVIQGRLGLIPATEEPVSTSGPTGWISKPERSAELFVQGLLTFLKLPHGFGSKMGEITSDVT